MPTYNYGQFIEQAVRSVFEQDYRPIELIVVDDGSTDRTWELLQRLQAGSPIPMKTIQGQHRGVSAALNLALSAASGEWICILAADDIARPDRVSKQLAVTLPGVVLVHSEYSCMDQFGAASLYDSSTDLPPAQGESLRDLLLLRSDVRSMTVMIRRAALAAQNPYDERLPSEDWQSILRLARAGTIAHVPEQLVERRVHSGSASVTGHRLKKTFSFTEIGIDVLREVTPPDLAIDRVLAIHTAVVLRNALALGAFEKVLDGLRKGFAEFPTQRALLLRETLRAVPSYFWVHGLRERLPKTAVQQLLKLKARAMKLRA